MMLRGKQLSTARVRRCVLCARKDRALPWAACLGRVGIALVAVALVAIIGNNVLNRSLKAVLQNLLFFGIANAVGLV